ncbi:MULTISPECIES: head-tail adaptor protein [unclassified Microbacterium]|uniref:head-tail adaptor protein n=1 Tax=unclassified Microbacterium TaxID=2609290 RepID=UPI00109C2AE9|nr:MULTISPECIES: head-tail adaptor protein [unclassified Microbacterium]
MTPRYEPVIIRRAVDVLNPDGDPVGADWADHITLSAKFAPSNPSEALEVGKNTVITGGTVYARDLPVRPDITSSDRASVRGVEYEIDGEIGMWLRQDTWAIQFAIRTAK